MNGENVLPPSDRTDAEGPRKKETFSQYLDRIAVQDHGLPSPTKDADKPWRRWVGKPSTEARIDLILAGIDPDAREPGEDAE